MVGLKLNVITYVSEARNMKLKGKATSGDGDASKFVAMAPYHDFLQDALDFSPFPGTLNLEVDPGEVEELKKEVEPEILESFEYEGKEFGGLKVYPVTVEDEEAGLLEIERTRHGEEVIELVAAEKLRDRVDLDNGDRVTISSDQN